MTPADYVEVVVLPTVSDYLSGPENHRLAYLSAIATYHIIDYIMRANLPASTSRGARKAEVARIEVLIRARCPEPFTIIESMCHGTKHCGRDSGTDFMPGTEEVVFDFRFDEDGHGFDESRLDRPGLEMMLGDVSWYVDDCLRVVLCAFRDLFPEHLGSIAIPTPPA